MATAQPVYEKNDTVDDTLLNQISKFLFFENLSSLARDLEVRETQIQKIRRASASPQDQIFKVLHTWVNRKTDFKVKDLVQEMLIWQKGQYLDREIWTSNIFSPSLLPGQSSVVPDKAESDSPNPTALSDQERIAFEKEDLDPQKWVPIIYEHFNIDKLNLLKGVERDRITGFLDGNKNTVTREALRVLLRELRCLYVPSFDLKYMTDLPDALNKRMRYLTINRDDDRIKCEELVDQLECTIWKWHNSSRSNYEFLTCLATLSLFNFSLEELSFNKGLQEIDIQNLASTLRRNFEEFKILKTIQTKQAFVLDIGMNNPFDKSIAVRYILGKLKNNISKKFTGCTKQRFDLIELKKVVKGILGGKNDARAFKEKQKALSMHFNAIFSRTHCESQRKEEDTGVKESVQSLLEDLGLTEYYPQKLGYSDVIKVTEDALKDLNEKPSALSELPWYFMRRLIGLNSTIREKGSAAGQKKGRKRKMNNKKRKGKKKRRFSEAEDEEVTFSWDDDSTDEDTEDEETKIQHTAEKESTANVMNAVHPLDLIYIIFLCADDFLRQELADKMSKCQYAVPFILPSAGRGGESQNIVLNWALQTITRTYCQENEPAITKSLLNVSCPIVNCLSLSTNNTWKSRLLNKMLSPQQDTFWHEGLEGGDRTQKVSQGMVEVSWYLPAGRGNDEFKTPVAFANLRGEAQQYPLGTESLVQSSNTSCVFTDKINKEVVTFLRKYLGRKHLRNMILVVLYNPSEEKMHAKKSKKLKKRLKLEDYQVINCPLVDSSFHTTYDALKRALQIRIQDTKDMGISLRQFIAEVKYNGSMKLDDVACSMGYDAAQRILSTIDAIESDRIKSKILPCQSDLATRELIGKHDKEICRQNDIAESDLMTQHVIREEEKKWELQWKQLQYPISDTFTQFLQYTINFNSLNRRYFLQTLKLGLNERSVELLQPLYEEYHQCHLEEKSENTDRKLRELNEQLTYSSLGLEHFFREMAIMYENMSALSKKLGSKEEDQLAGVLDRLSKVMADILLDGEAIEILDGDVVHSPVLWLKAVLNQIGSRERTRIFKVSALGAQSSGKSTLLNTIFGLHFPVSSGRCTRGAYMQLVKIEEKLANKLHCDYLLVIDSEGLMSRVSKNEDYDNELATFVIGLSDLTLVVIKGEGNEMQDVLPIAIHVFLRMNVLGELQACHFVHQNMGAVDVKKIMPVEIDTFVQLLDEKTRAAAQEAQKMKYTQFADVLQYDKNNDNTYVCGLWDGTPPMGKTDIEYSKTMQRLKGNILERVATITKKKNCSTIRDFSELLEVIWEAVKYENFVFSFRNVLAVEAYKKLWRIFIDKAWDIKKTMRENMDKRKKEIKDELMTETDNNRILEVIDNMAQKIFQDITVRIDDLSTCIRHYFHCPGCQEKNCNKEVKNRHFLRDHKGEFERDIWRFMKALEDEISHSVKSLTVEMSLHQDNAKMDDILKKEVQKLISKAKCVSFSENDKENIFDALWEKQTCEILMKFQQKVKPEIVIRKTVEKVIRDSLGSEDFRYIKKKTNKSTDINSEGFVLKKNHLNGNPGLILHRLSELRRSTELIIKRSALHYEKLAKGREFEPKHAETLFKDLQTAVDNFKKSLIETSLDYKVDLMLYVEELAVRNFSWNQRKHEEISSPGRLLEKKRDAYHDVFIIATRQENPAKGFGTIISKLIEENLEDRFTCTGLLQILRDCHEDIFRDAGALKFFSIIRSIGQSALCRLHSFSIVEYEEMIKETINEKSIACLKEKNLLKACATSELNRIIEEMKHAIQKTAESSCDSEDFVGTLFSNMNGLKKPLNDIQAYKMVIVDDKAEFTSALLTQLSGNIQNELIQNIESWDVATVIERKGLTKFILKEMIGCSFCDLRGSPWTNWHQSFLKDGVRYTMQIELYRSIYRDLFYHSHSCHARLDSEMVQVLIVPEDQAAERVQIENIFHAQRQRRERRLLSPPSEESANKDLLKFL